MRGSSRMLWLTAVTLASLVVAPLPVVAAPAEAPVDADTDTDTDELPVDTDTDELPVDTDTDEPPLDTDTDELPVDTDTDTDEPPLDTDTDTDTDTDADIEAPAPGLDLDSDVGEIDDGYDPLRDSPEARTARRWLGAGIAATSAGAVLVGGAIALGMTDPCDPLAGNNCFTDARNRAALTMGVPGGVLLLGGIAMTVVGALQKRRLFFDYAGGVSAGRDHIGVVVVGRF